MAHLVGFFFLICIHQHTPASRQHSQNVETFGTISTTTSASTTTNSTTYSTGTSTSTIGRSSGMITTINHPHTTNTSSYYLVLVVSTSQYTLARQDKTNNKRELGNYRNYSTDKLVSNKMKRKTKSRGRVSRLSQLMKRA